MRRFTDKPVLLSETAVGPIAGRAVKIPDLFRGMRRYNTLGLVWFDIAQGQGLAGAAAVDLGARPAA